MIEQGPTQIIRIHYPDQYPFSPKNLGQASCEGMPAFVGRPMLICSLASSIRGEESAKALQPQGRAVANISHHGNKWKGWELSMDGAQGQGRTGGGVGGMLPRVLCARNNTSSWQGG